MNADASILILEDERSQILALRSQLKGLGRLVEFTDPAEALAESRLHPCDAAIIDIGLPRSAMDGLAFLRALREFDRDLAIIIRTGSDSDEIADGAIELRAIKRAIKSKTTLAELRQSTREAIEETRQRREMRRSAEAAEATKVRLTEALGTFDLRLTAAELHRGLVHGLRDQLTALSSVSSLLQADAAQIGQATIAEHSRRCSDLAGSMIDSVNRLLSGSFGEGTAASDASVNECLAALGLVFGSGGAWAAQGKRVMLRDLLSDTRVACGPMELTNGLKHLVEFGLSRVQRGDHVSLTAAVILTTAQLAARLDSADRVLNRQSIRRDHPYVSLRFSAPLAAVTVDQVLTEIEVGGGNPQTGNLAVLAKVLTDIHGGLLLERGASGLLNIEALFPVAI